MQRTYRGRGDKLWFLDNFITPYRTIIYFGLLFPSHPFQFITPSPTPPPPPPSLTQLDTLFVLILRVITVLIFAHFSDFCANARKLVRAKISMDKVGES